MSLTLHTLSSKSGSRTKKFRVGRGQSSGRGKTAGRGTKGQRARTGGRKKLKLKGMKQMLLGFPKLRGFQSRYEKAAAIPVERLGAFGAGEAVTLASLKAKRLVPASTRFVKIIGSKKLEKKLVVRVAATAGAKAAIEAAGGSVEIPNPKKTKKTKKT